MLEILLRKSRLTTVAANRLAMMRACARRGMTTSRRKAFYHASQYVVICKTYLLSPGYCMEALGHTHALAGFSITSSRLFQLTYVLTEAFSSFVFLFFFFGQHDGHESWA